MRDALLGREAADLDWLVSDPKAACEAAASADGGTCFPLDEERGHWRAIGGVSGRTHDFVPLSGTVEGDLRRRDLTINAMGLTASGELLDPTGGADDLKERVIKVTSEAALRSDPIRPLRAVRFAAALGFRLDPDTATVVRELAAEQRAGSARVPAPERVRDELARLLYGRPAAALALAQDLGLLETFLPELSACAAVPQGPLHHLDVFDHSLEALRVLLEAFPDSGTALRLATLLHDVGKPATLAGGPLGRPTFHGHDAVGAHLTARALRRLRFDSGTLKRASALVRRHMLPLPRDERGARRFAHRYGDLLPDLLRLMIADREAARGRAAGPSGRTRYRLAVSRVLAVLEEKPAAAPLLTGDDVMDLLGLEEGPLVGQALRLVAEARAVGDVHDREGAESLLRRYAAANGWPTEDQLGA
ncbi:MAG TPA: HD domain-containing protein [Trueperaceae bacterium]